MGISRSGRVKHFGLTVGAWHLLPDTVRVVFVIPASRWRKETSKPLVLRLRRFSREAKQALYLERGAKENPCI